MYKLIEFINRDEELKHITKIISASDTQIIYINSGGGIGKTRLLEQIPHTLENNRIRATYVDIIDFDDLTFQFTDNLIHLLLGYIPNIGVKDKERIYQELDDLLRMERIGDSRETQEKQERRIISSLAELINTASESNPLIFRFDTVEKMPLNVRTNLLALAKQLAKSHMILVGRPEQNSPFSLWDQIKENFGHRIAHKLDLQPFDMRARREYLEKKEAQKNIKLSISDSEKLLSLSEGRPILIDLAVEFFSKSPEFKLKKDTGLLKLPDQESDRILFEKQIVQHVLIARGNIERLILVLSRVFPLTEEMVSIMLNLQQDDAKQLFKDVQPEAYIKTVRDQDGTVRISLHDEMRRLILEHVWPEFDPTHYRRRRDSKIARELFMNEDHKLRSVKKETQEQLAIRRVGDIESHIRIMLLRRQRELATEEWIKHGLYCDFTAGFKDWYRLIEKVRTEGRKYSFITRLCQLTQPYVEQLDGEANRFQSVPPDVYVTEQEKYTYFFVKARAKQDQGYYDEAEKIYQPLLADNVQNQARQRQIYNMLGVLKRDQGRLEQAIDYQKKCLALQEESNYWGIANVENQLGHLYRLHKDTDPNSRNEAENHFKHALLASQHCVRTSSDKDQKINAVSLYASIMNNLGYIEGLKRNFEEAELLCKQAIVIWERIERTREKAWAKTNLGVLARDQRQYQQSEQRLQEAIALLISDDDYRELSQAHLQLGWTQWFMGAISSEKRRRIALLEEARISLETSLKFARDHDYRQEQPDIYHQLASVYWYLWKENHNPNHKENARSLNRTAIEISIELENNRYAVDATVGEMEFDYDSGISENIDAHLQQLQPYRKYHFPLYFGQVSRILGDWKFREGKYDEAILEYIQALPLINEHGGYGPYAIEIELENLADKFQKLPQENALVYLNMLKDGLLQKTRTETGHVDLFFWIDEQVGQIELLKILELGK